MIDGMPEKLKRARKKIGMTQVAVSEATGIDRSQLSKMENGQAVPQTEDLMKLSGLYRVSADYLLGIDKYGTLPLDGLKDFQIEELERLVNMIKRSNRE